MEVMNYCAQTLLSDGIKVVSDLKIPVLTANDNNRLDENNFFKEMITSQYLKGIKETLVAYKNSLLPDRFLTNQLIYVVNTSDFYGSFLYDGDLDIIYVNFNTISDISCYKSSYVFGHEMGHKIEKYKANMTTYQEVSRILDVSVDGNLKILSETFADACGNIVYSDINAYHMLSKSLTEEKNEALKRLVLKTVYSV